GPSRPPVLPVLPHGFLDASRESRFHRQTGRIWPESCPRGRSRRQTSFNGGTLMSPWRDVTPDEATRMLGAESAATYVDVRSTAEYTQGHAPGSINVPLAEMDPMRGMTPNPDFVQVMSKLFPADRQLIVG